MTSFSLTVRAICIGVLGILMAYTLFLMRSGRLNAHVTLRWIVAESTAILMVLLWGMLPFISYTSVLNDRELLVVLAVIFFGFIAFLILDSLVRISMHTHQIKVLTQELALLRQSVHSHLDINLPNKLRENKESPDRIINQKTDKSKKRSMWQVFCILWIALCFLLYLLQLYPSYPVFLRQFFTANYLE